MIFQTAYSAVTSYDALFHDHAKYFDIHWCQVSVVWSRVLRMLKYMQPA